MIQSNVDFIIPKPSISKPLASGLTLSNRSHSVLSFKNIGLLVTFSKQASAGHRPVCAWFLLSGKSVCMCVCVRPRGHEKLVV